MGTVGGIGWSDAKPEPVLNHRGLAVGPFKDRVVCQTCGVIALPNFKLGWFVGVDVDLARVATDESYEPKHTYPFAMKDDDEPEEPAEPTTTRSTRPTSPEAPKVVPEPTSAPAAAPADADTPLAKRIRRQAGRAALGVTGYMRRRPDAGSRKADARAREKRRERARKAGQDPDTLGPDFMTAAGYRAWQAEQDEMADQLAAGMAALGEPS